MDRALANAFRQAYERMAAWSDLLDSINVYPVADADTGRNLRVSLAPLKTAQSNQTARRLLICATGNSGNIAGAFFSNFIRVKTCEDLTTTAAKAKDAAWQALLAPKPGTMLSAFDALVESLQSTKSEEILNDSELILDPIRSAVISTSNILPELKQAGIVDSGALGMYLFFEGFFKSLANRLDTLCNPRLAFGSMIELSNNYNMIEYNNYCIDTVLMPSMDAAQAAQIASGIGDQVVAVSDGARLKIHLHASDAEIARQNLNTIGEVLQWHTEKIENRISMPAEALEKIDKVHIATDAAGSVPLNIARELGISLLDSYIIMDESHLPESMVSADDLYAAMKRGVKVTTAQASTFERHQNFECLCQHHRHILYLCVGSVYTGNFATARDWIEKNHNGGQMLVLDTGAASGRLGLIACRVARCANAFRSAPQTVKYAQTVCRRCDELVFLDQLKFLAAGGRINKANGFFGDLLKIKPIIRPAASGAQKVAVVRSQQAQLEFALDYLNRCISDSRTPMDILLQHTDNEDRVVSRIQPQIQNLLPLARITVTPMSLTSGVHMGPGTWALAFLPDDDDPGTHVS